MKTFKREVTSDQKLYSRWFNSFQYTGFLNEN